MNKPAESHMTDKDVALIDTLELIFASRFGALKVADGKMHYATWMLEQKVRPDVFEAAMDTLAEEWGGKLGKPKLPQVKAAFWNEIRRRQDSRIADSKPCPRCNNDGFVWCVLGRESTGSDLRWINRDMPQGYPVVGVFCQPCSCHVGKVRNAKSYGYDEDLLHEFNQHCAFAFNSRSLADELRQRCVDLWVADASKGELQSPTNAAEQTDNDDWIEDLSRLVGQLDGVSSVWGKLALATRWFRHLGFIGKSDQLQATPAVIRDRARANPRGFLAALRAYQADARGGEATSLAETLFSGTTPAFSTPARRRDTPTPDPKKTRERNDTTRQVADVAPRKA